MLNGRWPHGLSTWNWVCDTNYHNGRAAIRHYANQTALVGAFSVITNLRMDLLEALQLTLLLAGGRRKLEMVWIKWLSAPVSCSCSSIQLFRSNFCGPRNSIELRHWALIVVLLYSSIYCSIMHFHYICTIYFHIFPKNKWIQVLLLNISSQ